MRVYRQGLIVWFQHMKNLKQIKRQGHLIYVSKEKKYAVLYVNKDEVEEKERKLNGMSFVSRVELSHKPDIKTSFENKKTDKAKEYDYKMGI